MMGDEMARGYTKGWNWNLRDGAVGSVLFNGSNGADGEMAVLIGDYICVYGFWFLLMVWGLTDSARVRAYADDATDLFAVRLPAKHIKQQQKQNKQKKFARLIASITGEITLHLNSPFKCSLDF